MENIRIEEGLEQEEDQRQVAPGRRIMAAAAEGQENPPPPPPSPKKCPRCDSGNTKFCYYNNYSLAQPRYFCRACRRYWTHGGGLRNVPVGGGCRKIKRPKPTYADAGRAEAPAPRTGSSSSIAIPTHDLTGMVSGSTQSVRPFPPAAPSMGSFYSSGNYLSSLAAMQSFMQPGMIGNNQRPGTNLASSSRFGSGGGHTGGGGPSLSGMYLQSMKPPAPPQQFNVRNEFYRPQQSLINPSNTVLNSWSRPANILPSIPSSWGSGTGDFIGDHAAGPSMNANHWSDNDFPGFDPSQ